MEFLFRSGPEQERVMINRIPVIDMSATGKNIARLRREAGLSVRELQTTFGFSTPQAIYKWQHGETLPTLDNIVILAAALGVAVDEILICREIPQEPAGT